MIRSIFKFKRKFYLCLSLPFSLRVEGKHCLTGVRWSPVKDKDYLTDEFKIQNSLPVKFWWCEYIPRNLVQIRRLMGENIHAIYDEPTNLRLVFKDSWDHQNDMTNHSLQRKRVLIAAEPRTGKTKASLDAAQFVKDNYKPDLKVWFVTRKGAMDGIHDEIRIWGFDLDIDVITYRKFVERRGCPDFLILDECHAVKSYGAKTSQQAEKAYDTSVEMGKDGYVILMSGTPVPKIPSEWWSLAEIAYTGFLSAKSKMVFAREIGEWESQEARKIEDGQEVVSHIYPVLKGWKEEKVKEIHHRLRGLLMVKLKKDCLDLPEIMIQMAYMETSREQKEIMQVIKTLPKKNKGAQLRIALRKTADGFFTKKLPNKEGGFDDEHIHFKTNKDERLKNHLDEFHDIGRLVVYCGFTETVEKVIKLCEEANWAVLRIDGIAIKTYNTHHTVEECQYAMNRATDDGQIDRLVVVAQMDAAGVGREFSATPVQVCYSSGEKSDSKEQAKNRFHSNNMDKERGACWIEYECMYIDKLMRESLDRKQDIQLVSLGELERATDIDWYAPEQEGIG